jgi:hypothetical protein
LGRAPVIETGNLSYIKLSSTARVKVAINTIWVNVVAVLVIRSLTHTGAVSLVRMFQDCIEVGMGVR